MKNIVNITALALMATACGQSSPETILGVTRADGPSFTLSPGGSALALLYDDFVVEWHIGDPGRADQTKAMTRHVAMAMHGTPAVWRVHVRGFWRDPGMASGVRLKVDGKTAPIEPPAKGDALFGCFDVTTKEGGLDLELTAILKRAPGTDAMISIDSIDIARGDMLDMSERARKCLPL